MTEKKSRHKTKEELERKIRINNLIIFMLVLNMILIAILAITGINKIQDSTIENSYGLDLQKRFASYMMQET